MLSPNRTYYYRVKAVNSTSESSYSDIVSVTTTDNSLILDPLPASTPSLVELKSYRRSVKFAVEIPPQDQYISQYAVTISTNSDYSAPLYANRLLLAENLPVTSLSGIKCYSVLADKLAPATTYYYRISAINANGASDNLEGTFTTIPLAESPVALGVTDLTAISAKLLWSRVKDAATYYLDISTSPTFSSGNILTNTTVSEAEAFYTLSSLEENTVYYFRVRALVGATTSPSSNALSFTTLDDIATGGFSFDLVPPTIKVAYTTNSEISLTWSEVRGNQGYLLDIAIDAAFVSKVVDGVSVMDPYYTATSLTANTAYYVRVATIGTYVNSSYAQLTTSTKQLEASLTPPALIAPTTIQSTGFILRWVKRSYATNYLIRITAPVARTFYAGDIDTLLISDLTPATAYDVEIIGLSASQISNASDSLEVTTVAALPSITLSTPELTGTSALLAWSTNAAYTKYFLSIWKEEGNYLGSNFFRNRDVGDVGSFSVDIFLESNTQYSYRITALTANNEATRSSVGTFTTLDFGTRISLRNYSILSSNKPFNKVWASASASFDTYVDGYPMTFSAAVQQADISTLLSKGLYFIKVQLDNGAFSNIIGTSSQQSKLFPLKQFADRIEVKWNPYTATKLRLQIYADNVPVFAYPLEQSPETSFYIINNPVAGSEYKVVMEELDATLGIYTIVDELTMEYFDYDILTNPLLPTPTLEVSMYNLFAVISVEEDADEYIYELFRNDDAFPETFLTSTSKVTLLPLELNSTYTLKGSLVIDGKESDPTEVVLETSGTYEAAPTISGAPALSFTIANETEAFLTWNDLDDVDRYVVQVSATSTFNQLDPEIWVDYPTKRTAIISGLSSSSTYYVRVYGVNSSSISNYSNTVTINTGA